MFSISNIKKYGTYITNYKKQIKTSFRKKKYQLKRTYTFYLQLGMKTNKKISIQ